MVDILWTFTRQDRLTTKTVEHTIYVRFTAMRTTHFLRRVTMSHLAGSPQMRMLKVNPSFLVVNHVHAMSRDMLISRANNSIRRSLTKELTRILKALPSSLVIYNYHEVVPGSPQIWYFPHFVWYHSGICSNEIRMLPRVE